LSTDSKTLLHWLGQFPPTALPLWVYSTTESGGGGNAKIWVVASPSHLDLSRLGPPADYNTIIGERPQGGIFQGSGYWNNTQDIPQIWAPMTTGTRFVDIANWATHVEGTTFRVQFLRPYKNYLMMGGLSHVGGAFPFAVRWSHPAIPGATPTSFDISDPATLANEFDFAETGGYVIDGLTLGEIFVVYKESTTWGMQLIQGQDVMRRWRIIDDSGILWRDCVVTYPKGHFVVTQTDIITHNGTRGSEKSVIEHKLRRWLFSVLNTNSYKNSFCVTIEARKEVWFFFPTGNSTYADMVLMWSWANDTVGIRSLPVPGVPFATAGLITTSDEPVAWG